MPNNINFKVNCRHDYTGHSQWNEAHAMSKAARFGDDDVYVAGHRHNSAYQMIKRHETGRIAHAVRVSGLAFTGQELPPREAGTSQKGR